MRNLLMFVKVAVCEAVALLAPLVTLVYRRGWFNTPDNPDSPHGLYESKMVRIYQRYGAFVSDWWWLGVRNRAYGLRYALKPAHFKALGSYADCVLSQVKRGNKTVTEVDGYREYVYQYDWGHVIVGYRLTPIYNEVLKNRYGIEVIPFRPVNMDARPILSFRSGQAD